MNSPDKLDRLIVFEGIDGAGTTTQAKRLVERIRGAGHQVWGTNEPTGSPIGKLLRRVLAGDVPVTQETAAYLFATDRWEHVFGDGGIIEHHERGQAVVCDRYLYSSLVYQSIGGNEVLVKQLNSRFPAPGLVIFVDLPIEVGEQRLAERSRRDIYENIEFQRSVRARYLEEIGQAAATTSTVIVAGDEPQDEVHRKIWEAVGEASILEA
jgi:dTMP kinase